MQQWAQQDQFQEHQAQQMQYAEEESNDEPYDEIHRNFVSHLHTKVRNVAKAQACPYNPCHHLTVLCCGQTAALWSLCWAPLDLQLAIATTAGHKQLCLANMVIMYFMLKYMKSVLFQIS